MVNISHHHSKHRTSVFDIKFDYNMVADISLDLLPQVKYHHIICGILYCLSSHM